MKIKANGISLNVTDQGQGATSLVFLHFWGGSSKEWNPVISRLADRYRCVAIDLRGQGDSDAPSTGYSINDLADDVLGVIDSLGIKKYIVVGHSMGGKTAQVIASRRPAGLAGIALIASSPPSPMPISDEQRVQMKTAYGSPESVNFVLDNVLMGSIVSADLREQAVADALRLSAQAVDGWIETGTREDFSEAARLIDVPVVLVAGDADKVDPMAVVRSHLVPCYPDAALHVLAGKGHLLPLEAPVEVAQVIFDFAAQLN